MHEELLEPRPPPPPALEAPTREVGKGATPAERVSGAGELQRDLARIRPQTLLSQRDSDANRVVESSRESALSKLSTLSVDTSATLARHFKTDYIPRVFCTTLPWCVGGPDFPRQRGWRRQQ